VLCLPRLIVLLLASLYGQFWQQPMVAGAVRGMGAVAAGLIIATALKLIGTLRANVLGPRIALLFATLAFAAIGLLRWPLVGVVLGLGALAVATAWFRLRP
jgi:chromate transporter